MKRRNSETTMTETSMAVAIPREFADGVSERLLSRKSTPKLLPKQGQPGTPVIAFEIGIQLSVSQ
ncbi:hypothetical protein MNBD_CHLOROFLEXI01-4336 [hydrothermal vent metagenome]|uniref:Uncharacterized protein n=1 Tax=hydrothermal vent metagenome TaxID=652676 RepID=A0A3B0V166_9ZZZZ